MADKQRAEVPRRIRAITSNWTNLDQLTLTGSIGRPCQPGHTAILSGRHTYDVKKKKRLACKKSLSSSSRFLLSLDLNIFFNGSIFPFVWFLSTCSILRIKIYRYICIYMTWKYRMSFLYSKKKKKEMIIK